MDAQKKLDVLEYHNIKLEATETEKSENLDHELGEGEEDDDSEKRRERR